LRFSTSLNRARNPGDPVWEFGVNFGLTHPQLGVAQAEQVQISKFDDVYFRGGLGFRGPFFHKNGFSLGLVLEGDFSALPYSVDVVRNTKESIETVSVLWIPLGWHSGVGTVENKTEHSSEDVQHLTGHAFFPTFRGGLYGSYYFNRYMALTFGMALQNTPLIEGVVLQKYTCVYESDLFKQVPKDVAAQCRADKGKDFPIIKHALAGTLYGGLSVMFEHLVVSLRLQSHLAFANGAAYAAPISGDMEVAFVF
jgi:hypothetical protein